MSQLYAKQEKHVLFEVKVPPGTVGQKRGLADVGVSYANLANKKRGTKRASVGVEYAASPTAVASKQNKAVLEAAIEAIGNDENKRAVTLRDQGKVDEAQRVLQTNAANLQREAVRLKSQKLIDSGRQNAIDAQEIKGDYTRARKTMRENQTKSMSQRSW
jgi:Ca-activated chloride channel family protein